MRNELNSNYYDKKFKETNTYNVHLLMEYCDIFKYDKIMIFHVW